MRTTVVFFVFLCGTLMLNAEDLTITARVTEDGGDPEMTTSYISGDHLRIAQPGGNEVIMDLESGDMTVVDGKKRTYYVVTRKDLDAMAARIDQQMNSPESKQAQEQMKNLPPELQEKMKSMMGDMFDVDVKRKGTTRKIAGYKCEDWVVTIGSMSRSEQCVTTELRLPEQSWENYRRYMDSLRNAMQAMGPMAGNMEAMGEELQKIKGFPLADKTTTNVMGHSSVTTTEVTSIKEGAIPDSAWDIPEGFKKVDNPMMKSMKRRKG